MRISHGFNQYIGVTTTSGPFEWGGRGGDNCRDAGDIDERYRGGRKKERERGMGGVIGRWSAHPPHTYHSRD